MEVVSLFVHQGMRTYCQLCSNSHRLVHCEANPSFKLFDSGGDGSEIQYCACIVDSSWLFALSAEVGSTGFVGYDPAHDTAIVAHQGTNVAHMYAV